VQNTYQRRLDLLPNLVNVVKGSSEFEQSTLIDIVRSRASKVNVEAGLSVEQQQAVQDSFASATNRVLAVIESYPDLKGTQAYATLQAQIEGTERRIKFARTDYNAAVADYNKKVRSFPTNLIASVFGFSRAAGFNADQGADRAVEIKF
jgi:LemA protein